MKLRKRRYPRVITFHALNEYRDWQTPRWWERWAYGAVVILLALIVAGIAMGVVR